MAKQITQCDCGGSYDGTPSGKSKHIATAKHVGYEIGLRIESRAKVMASKPGEVLAAARATGLTPDELATDEGFEAVAAKLPKPAIGRALVDPEGYVAAQNATLQSELTILITDKEQELARRQIDHKYRERHSGEDKASAYFATKVVPLKSEIDTLRAVRKALGQ